MKQIKVTLVKSTIGAVKKQQATVEALGLHKIGQSTVFTDSEVSHGILRVVSHFVKVEEA